MSVRCVLLEESEKIYKDHGIQMEDVDELTRCVLGKSIKV